MSTAIVVYSPPRYWGRDGRPISLWGWACLLESGLDYRVVASTVLPDGKWVSTVWLGLDHGWGEGPPLIFETMVFPRQGGAIGSGAWDELDCERYATEADAVIGHEYMVNKWSQKE